MGERFMFSFLSLDKNELRAKAKQEVLEVTWIEHEIKVSLKKVKVVKIKS